MVLAQWNPPTIDCTTLGRHPNFPACDVALGEMPASEFQQVFGSWGQPDVDVWLPVRFSSRQCIQCSLLTHLLTHAIATYACSIEVSISGPPVHAAWYGIWASAVSMVARCARAYKGAVSVGRSKFPAPVMVMVDETDMSTAVGASEITIRVTNDSPGSVLEIASE